MVVGNPGQEISLVFYRVGSSGKPYLPVDGAGGCIMPCGGHVELMPPTLFEESEFYHFVAHDVGVGGKPFFDSAQCVLHHVVPVFLVERHNFERQVEFRGNIAAHLDVLLGRAITLVVIHTDADIEKV